MSTARTGRGGPIEFTRRHAALDGSGQDGLPSHAEAREVMYQVCTERGWWDLRGTKIGRARFPEVPLRLRPAPPVRSLSR
jgi:hypothetical protein